MSILLSIKQDVLSEQSASGNTLKYWNWECSRYIDCGRRLNYLLAPSITSVNDIFKSTKQC